MIGALQSPGNPDLLARMRSYNRIILREHGKMPQLKEELMHYGQAEASSSDKQYAFVSNALSSQIGVHGRRCSRKEMTQRLYLARPVRKARRRPKLAQNHAQWRRWWKRPARSELPEPKEAGSSRRVLLIGEHWRVL